MIHSTADAADADADMKSDLTGGRRKRRRRQQSRETMKNVFEGNAIRGQRDRDWIVHRSSVWNAFAAVYDCSYWHLRIERICWIYSAAGRVNDAMRSCLLNVKRRWKKKKSKPSAHNLTVFKHAAVQLMIVRVHQVTSASLLALMSSSNWNNEFNCMIETRRSKKKKERKRNRLQ